MSNVKVIDYKDKRQDFELYHQTGGAENRYTGFECINKFWKFAQDGVTDLTGAFGSGKTEFALELLFFQAENFGKRFMIYLPDVGSYNEIRRKLLVKYYKRPFRGYDNALNEKERGELTKACAFIDYHFLILGKNDSKKPISPLNLYEFCADYKDNNGIGVDGLLIDAWASIFHEYKGTEVNYLDNLLPIRNDIAESSQKHFMSIVHPTKMEILQDTKKRRIPDANDLNGGAAWGRHGKTIITVDKPNMDTNEVDIYFSKIKPDTLGKKGTIIGSLDFFWKHSRYRETINGVIYYAGEAKKEIKNTEFTPILRGHY
jgi:hypothetical protein